MQQPSALGADTPENSNNIETKEEIMSELIAGKILNNPKYVHLVHQRNAFALLLSAIVCVMYFGFILMVAYAPGIITQPIASDSVIPLGMLIGVGVILVSCMLTGVYVYRANTVFDPIVNEIVREASK
jgi:uncharacterized membrane protein (DUF485 family)